MEKILLEWTEVGPDKPNGESRTPLSYAASAGREGAVKILLEREEVNPDMPDNFSPTPLSLATEFALERLRRNSLAKR